jgi:hypothetical protein
MSHNLHEFAKRNVEAAPEARPPPQPPDLRLDTNLHHHGSKPSRTQSSHPSAFFQAERDCALPKDAMTRFDQRPPTNGTSTTATT